MRSLSTFYIATLLLFSCAVIAQAAGERDLIIQKELDCVEQRAHQTSSIDWNDVCDTSDQQMQEDAQENDLRVKKQMDQLQKDAEEYDLKSRKEIAAMQKDTPPQSPFDESRVTGHTFDIAPEVSYIKYVETNNNTTFMKDTGVMYGLNASYTTHIEGTDNIYTKLISLGRLEGLFSYGKMTYYGAETVTTVNPDGSITRATLPETHKNIDDYLLELRGLIGKDFYFNDQWARLTPYTGFGYRSLFDSAEELGSGGYNRWISYAYIPTGLEGMLQLNGGWAIGADAEYDIFVYGFVKNYDYPFVTPDGSFVKYDVYASQNRGFGLRGSLKLVKKCSRFNFMVEPYVRYWHIQNSNGGKTNEIEYNGQEGQWVNVGIEPNNTSLEMGGKLSVQF